MILSRGLPLVLAVSVFCAQIAAAQSIPLPFTNDTTADRISVTVSPGRRNMRGLSASLITARQQMHAHQPVSDENLRRLADADDGLAAQLYVRRLLATDPAAQTPSDIAYYSAIAVGTGRVWTLPDMIDAMYLLDPATEPRNRLRKYIQVLYPYAWAGNTLALDAIIAFNGEGKLFGALSDSTRAKILEQSKRNGDGLIELRLAMALLEQDDLSESQQNQAKGFLQLAQASSHLGVMTAAQNLIELMDKKYAEQR